VGEPAYSLDGTILFTSLVTSSTPKSSSRRAGAKPSLRGYRFQIGKGSIRLPYTDPIPT